MDITGRPSVDSDRELVQKAGQIGRGLVKEGFVNEGEPVDVSASVKRWPVNPRIKITVMSAVG